MSVWATRSDGGYSLCDNIEENVDYRYIAKELLNEHPQTIAVALSRLSSEHSSQILKLLPSFIQADLVNRIVETDQIPSMVIEEVDRMLARIMK